MNIMNITGNNKNVFHCIKALCKSFKHMSVLAVSQKLNHEPDLRELYETAYKVKIHC